MKIRAAAAATLQGCNAMADDRSIELNSKFSGGDGDGDAGWWRFWRVVCRFFFTDRWEKTAALAVNRTGLTGYQKNRLNSKSKPKTHVQPVPIG